MASPQQDSEGPEPTGSRQGIEATVQHSYHAEKDDELDLEEGDVVQVFESRKDGWLRGMKQKRSGWFPGRHIKGCTKEIVKLSRRAKEDDELDLEEGDIVLVFDKQKDGWWRGMIGEREGWFPAEMLQGYSPEVVQYSYRAEKDDEIDLVIGEVIQVFAKNEDGRCKGVIGEREGWFPGNCTRELPPFTQALVETPHHGDDDDELDLEKDQIVDVLLKRDSDWWIGLLKGKKGLFPANNVKEIKVIKAAVQHSYCAEKDDELDLEEGDVVQVFESRKDGWLRGVKQERSGWFPWSHIKGCTKEIVKFSYRAEKDQDLDLEEGDVVLVFDKQKGDWWWRGMIRERQGLFPADILQGYSPEIVQHFHRAEKDDEIDLVIGDVLIILERSEDGRCKGMIGEREGWFPGNCTRELPQYGTQALVETPHHGDDGELDLEKDDVVDILLKRDSDCWIGQLKGKKGLFPANNVKEIKGIETTVQHSYCAEKGDELDLEEGDVVQVIESRKDGWLRAVKQERSGWFPWSHIKGCTKEIVEYPFCAERGNQLDLEEGDVVLVFDKQKDGWWRGMIGEREGRFPAGYLQGYTQEIVQYSYHAEKDDEIDLAIGEAIYIREKSEDGRCKGVVGEREGWFPGNCTIEVLKITQALVETPHHGDDDDELDLEKGHVVNIMLKRDSDWWIGQLKGKSGLFPAKNVKEINVIEATVQHSYRAEKGDELDLEEGDVVQVIESRKDGWLRGVKQERSGWFPWSHIKGCTKEIVKLSCLAEDDDELDLEEGDIVLVFEKENDGWWRGMIGEREGWFPAEMLQGYSPEIVQHSYHAQRDDEIDLEIGDIVQVFEKSEDGRCKGVIGGREGWFPGTCTRELPKNTQALVETPHHGDDDDKLDLEKDEIVDVLLKRDSDWWIGQLKGKSGLFPAKNVKEIKVIEATVQHSYCAEKDDELDLEEGDVVQVFESRKDGWLRGVKQEMSGWFPGCHIKGCTKEIVKYPYSAERDQNLDLEEGDVVLVFDKQKGSWWWTGMIGKREGRFPADCLQGYTQEVVQHSYHAEKDDEIDLAVGDVLLILEKSEDGRCKGVDGRKEGWFPGNCTRELPEYSTEAIVETPHHGDDDELDLEKGDVVTVMLKRDSDWWIGKVKEKKGLFPANNVKEIKVITATVQHSFHAEKDDELDLEEGDIVLVIESRKDGWLRGVKQDRCGWFPGSHIKGCTKEIVKISRRAGKDYELDLEEGDIVLVFEKHEDGWWRGMIGEKEGLLPADMLQGYSPEIVQYSHCAKKDDEIDLAIGDIVLVFEKSEDGRCKGVIGEREGWFSENCTRELPKATQALVETPHHGDDDGGLDLEKSDVVTVLLKRDSDWWIGKLKGKKGLFPANNVKEIKVIEATVQYSYRAEKDDELDLEEGDVVQVFESRKDGWLKGVKQERFGLFPGSHIKGCTQAIVLYSFDAEEDDELDLEEGDVVQVFEKIEHGWWRGMIGERKGLFLEKYVLECTRVIVQYSYRAEEDDEIDLVIGDVVLVFEKSGDGRCKGVIDRRKGWFPGNRTIELPRNSSRALVETPHHGDDDDKLDLEIDEIVDVLLKRDSDWWIGQLKGKKGLFPANNVKEIKGIEATVQHSYRAEKDDELDLEKGDVVQVFESRKDGWLRAVKQERSGWFPGSHIKGCTQATVQHSYRAEKDDELDLKEGDVVQVLAKGEDGRWRGVNRKRIGWFPATCVKEQPSHPPESKELKKALEFQKNLEDVLKTSASVTLKITKCTTIGPPEVGKTHLKCLLLGQEWDPNTGRTDVIRAPEWVEHYIEDSSTWKLFERDERMQAIFRNIMNKKYQEGKEEVQRGKKDVQRGKEDIQRGGEEGQKGKEKVQKQKEEAQKGKEEECQRGREMVQRGKEKVKGKEDDQKRKMHESNPETEAAFQQHKEPNEEKNVQEAKKVHEEFSEVLSTLDASLGDVLKGNHLSDTEHEGHIMGEKRLLYFVDTGGQEYYHDIHPILITSPSVYFVVFNLMKCLEEGGGANFFREELIQRPLRSIHAFGTKQVRQSKFLKIHPSDPKIFIIGTHLDQVREADREEEIESVSSNVQSELLTKPYNRFLQPDPSDLAFWPIDNTLAGNPLDEDSEDSEYICDLKSEAVEGVYDAEVTVPLSWLILEQTMKTVPEGNLFPYRQLFNLCSKRKLVRGEEEFKTMLYIFHILGLFFFPPILKDAPLRDDEIVYTNPDFLYRMTSKLLKECLFRESPIAKETCPQQGVIHDYRKLLSEIGVKESSRESFLNMLQDLKIIVKIESEDLILFPAALPSSNQVTSSEAPSSPGPLLLSFTSSRLLRVCYIPTGFFRLLIADLAANPTWTLDLDKLSHNSVMFDVGTGVLGLLERVSFIEVTFTPSDNSLPPSSSYHAMYQHLKERVLSLWSNVYGQKDESSEQWVHWGFPCKSESHPEEHHTHIAKFIGDQGEYVASCLHPAGKFIQRVCKEQLMWFMN